jgi:tetratricopeptide (TPR) repeat protein
MKLPVDTMITTITDAKNYFEKTLEMDPQNALAYNGLGLVLSKNKETKSESEVCFQKAIHLNPNYVNPYRNLANLLYDYNDELHQTAAEHLYKRAVELDPSFFKAYNSLGAIYIKKGRIDDAKEMFQKAKSVEKSYCSPRIALAGIYKRTGDSTKCKQLIDEARPLLNEESNYNKACFYSIAGNKDRAFHFLKLSNVKDALMTTWAKDDPDFDFIRDDPRFAEIVGE